MPETDTVRAFLTDRHIELARQIDSFAAREIEPLPEPADDSAARAQAVAKGLGELWHDVGKMYAAVNQLFGDVDGAAGVAASAAKSTSKEQEGE